MNISRRHESKNVLSASSKQKYVAFPERVLVSTGDEWQHASQLEKALGSNMELRISEEALHVQVMCFATKRDHVSLLTASVA